MKPGIIIADDHVLVAQGIQKLLEQDVEVVKIVSDGRALVQAIAESEPDLVIVDISLPLLNGLDAARQIRRAHPRLKILVLTMHADKMFVVEAFQVGVSGYVLKQSLSNELQQAVREVLNGKIYISPSVAQGLVDHVAHPRQPEYKENTKSGQQSLSTRQREVLQLVAEGRSTKEIAEILHVSSKTVEFHRTRIMKGLGLRTRPELTKYAIANGLISLNDSPASLSSV